MSLTADSYITVSDDYDNIAQSVEQKTLDGLQMAITRTITDTFALCGEEQIWLLYKIGNLLEPLRGHKPQMVAIGALNEMNRTNVSYSTNNITGYVVSNTPKLIYDPNAAQATQEEWASVIVNIINTSYNLSELTNIQIKAKLMGVLAELGVGNPHHPRPSRYLPSDVLYLMNTSR